MSATIPSTSSAMPRPRGYVPAVGPRLKKLLLFVFALVALLGANSVYLVSVTIQEAVTGLTYQNYFYQCMFLLHLALGLLLLLPFVTFGIIHWITARNRKNRRAVRVGYALLAVSIALLVSGLALMRIGSFDLKQPLARSVVYWLHVITPLGAGWLYWLHRLAGPRIKWRYGLAYAGVVGVVVAAMVGLHSQDPRRWNVAGPASGAQYFFPSEAVTATGNFIPAQTLMMDSYCLKCHEDAYNGWFHSAHRRSSFNNAMYFASVKETREVALKRDGNVQASRWCAGCHDPVPFFSGAFDDPKFDMVKHGTSQAGITCTVCHAITNINSTIGNGDYTIEEPQHYPFAFSENPFLQFVNNQMVKAKPSFHKKTFLKPLHKSTEFCSTCHKVGLPKALNHYKEFLRGQNHHDSFLLSGVSGHGARSFYYPDVAKQNCAECHMPLAASSDFGARDFDKSGKTSIHDHLFPGANTALPFLNDEPEFVKAQQEFMKGVMRVDLFGVKEGGTIDGPLVAPLRPEVPTLKPGGKYLFETVVRTLKMGHHFTQGTVDSNEVWLDVTVSSDGNVIGRSGGIDDDREVDPWSHFINVYMLDKDGNRIDRRNPQDIFTPLYNHQIPPGAAQVVHYELRIPEGLTSPVTVELKLQYRKFDKRYMDFVTKTAKPGENPIRGYEPGKPYLNDLPITTLAVDSVTFPIEGVAVELEPQKSAIADPWQRWNDYGIGLLLEGQGPGVAIGGKSELKQAEHAFLEVEKLNRFDGPLNLARVYFTEGRLDEAVDALHRAEMFTDPPAPPWTIAWFTGLVNKQQGHLDDAIVNFKSTLYDTTAVMRERKFDFSKDYIVLNELGQTLFERSKQERGESRRASREQLMDEAIKTFEATLKLDSEDVMAHYNLAQLYRMRGDQKQADEHSEAHLRYKPDDNAQDRAINLARQNSLAANHAAEKLVIYSLQRPNAPGLHRQQAAKPAKPGRPANRAAENQAGRELKPRPVAEGREPAASTHTRPPDRAAPPGDAATTAAGDAP
ncbi:MAG: tetratricopeptide repeat protein [Planctomycetaceae bacterium]|nr:tetratricopeptide repeat protein [Planctomycetaceae bacterium]